MKKSDFKISYVSLITGSYHGIKCEICHKEKCPCYFMHVGRGDIFNGEDMVMIGCDSCKDKKDDVFFQYGLRLL